MVEDSERIAAEVAHELVQGLFHAGLELQLALRCTSDPTARAHLLAAIAAIDASIQTIRRAALPGHHEQGSLSAR